jgi:1,4-dihydroxy-2-naphthoyl-CoA hydrolase
MSIWFHEISDDVLTRLGGGIDSHLGIQFTEFGPDFIRGTMPVDERTTQPLGLLHGGANVVLAESLGSIGTSLTIDHEKYFNVGVEVNANHLASATKGHVTGTARPIHLGRSIQVWGIEIVNGEGKISCVSRLTSAIRERRETSRINK